MSFVLDNSVSSRWLLEDGSQSDLAYADEILAAISEEIAVVPVIWGLGMANVIARAERNGSISESRSKRFLEFLNGIDIRTDDETFSRALTDTLDLARRYKLSAYDASYLELAIRLQIPIATLDEKLQKAAQKAGVKKV